MQKSPSKEPELDLLTAAKELQKFILTQQPGALHWPPAKCDVRDTVSYRLASDAISRAESCKER